MDVWTVSEHEKQEQRLVASQVRTVGGHNRRGGGGRSQGEVGGQ